MDLEFRMGGGRIQTKKIKIGDIAFKVVLLGGVGANWTTPLIF